MLLMSNWKTPLYRKRMVTRWSKLFPDSSWRKEERGGRKGGRKGGREGRKRERNRRKGEREGGGERKEKKGVCVWGGGGEGGRVGVRITLPPSMDHHTEIEKLSIYLRDVGDEISSDQYLAGEILNDSLLFLGELVWLQNEG